nr:capsid protein [Astroviridae sp.]
MSTPEGTRRPKAKKNVTVTVSTDTKPKRSRSRSRSRGRNGGAQATVRVVGNSPKAVLYQRAATRREKLRLQRRGQRYLQKEIDQLKKRTKGPPVSDLHTLTLTLGTINGVGENDLSRQLRYPLSPVLLKLEDAGKSITPLSERAHQYNLWKLQHLSVHLVPLVNGSNISGTLALVDLDQDGGSVKPDTVDTIKARCHAEAHIGQRIIFTPPQRQLWGPRQGWWLVDTNEDSAESFGPALNFWSYLVTQNLLHITGSGEGKAAETTVYKGPLWLVELRAKYAFANYEPKPALAVLGTTNAEVKNAKFVAGQNGELIIEANSTQLFRFCGKADGRRVKAVAAANLSGVNLSNVLYSMADDTVKAFAPALGPWGWILRAGWWVVRQILPGADTSEDEALFRGVVYPSVKAAQDNEPVYATDLSNLGKAVTLPSTHFKIQQLNSPNLNTANPENDVLVRASGTEEQNYPLSAPNRITKPPKIGVWLPARELWAAMGLPNVCRFNSITIGKMTRYFDNAAISHFYLNFEVYLNAQTGVHKETPPPFKNPFFTSAGFETHEIYTWWPVACQFSVKNSRTRLCFMKTQEPEPTRSAIFADLQSICNSLKSTKEIVYGGFGMIASFTTALACISEKEQIKRPEDAETRAPLSAFFPDNAGWKTWKDFFRNGKRPSADAHIWYAMGRQDFSIGRDHDARAVADASSYRGIPVHFFVSPHTGEALALTWMQYFRPDAHWPTTGLHGYTGQPLCWTLLWTKDADTLTLTPANYALSGPLLNAVKDSPGQDWTQQTDQEEIDSLLEELELIDELQTNEVETDLAVSARFETPLVKTEMSVKTTSEEELQFWKNLAQQLLKQGTNE